MVGSDVVGGLTTWKDEPALREAGHPGRGGPARGRPGGPPARVAGRPGAGGPVRRVEHRAAGPARGRTAGGGLVPEPVIRCIERAGSVRYGEMTQRATPTKSGTSALPTAPHPDWPVRLPTDPEADAAEVINEPSALERAGPAAPDTPPAEPPEAEHLSRSESQRAARSERRCRRRLAIACALLVAGCLVVTLLIVALARTRRRRSPGAGVRIGARRLDPASAITRHPYHPVHRDRRRPGARRRPPLTSTSALPVVDHDGGPTSPRSAWWRPAPPTPSPGTGPPSWPWASCSGSPTPS